MSHLISAHWSSRIGVDNLIQCTFRLVWNTVPSTDCSARNLKPASTCGAYNKEIVNKLCISIILIRGLEHKTQKEEFVLSIDRCYRTIKVLIDEDRLFLQFLLRLFLYLTSGLYRHIYIFSLSEILFTLLIFVCAISDDDGC